MRFKRRRYPRFPKRKMGKVTKKVKNYVKRAIDSRIEDKYYATDFAAVEPLLLSYNLAMVAVAGDASTNGLFLLNVMPKGDDVVNRNADVIMIKSLKVKIVVRPNAIAPAAYDSTVNFGCRVIIFRTKSPEGIVPYSSDFQTNSAGQGAFRVMLPNLKYTNEVYYDRTFNWEAPGNITAATAYNFKKIEFTKYFKKPLKTVFYPAQNTANNWGSVKRNALACCVIATPNGTAAGVSTCSLFDLQSVITYEDA